MNGYLMSKNVIIAEIHDNNIRVIKEELLPLLIKKTMSIELWLENRVIDKHRPSSRVLRKMLRLTTSDDIEVVMKFNAVSLTDTYWVKPLDSTLKWEEVIKCTDYFSSVITDGFADLYEDYSNKQTFELTNVGSYEKCWKRNAKTKEWYMIKRQDADEVVSEMLAYKAAKLLKIPVAKYIQISETLIGCENFIHNWNYNFEDAFSIVGEDEDTMYNMLKLTELKESLGVDFVYMRILDAIILNVDRHTHNYGILRNIKTGEVVSMAPMFDHNMCLLGCKSILKDESPFMYFAEIRDALNMLKDISKIKLPKLNRNDFNLSENDKLNKFLWNNYCKVCSLLNNMKGK